MGPVLVIAARSPDGPSFEVVFEVPIARAAPARMEVLSFHASEVECIISEGMWIAVPEG